MSNIDFQNGFAVGVAAGASTGSSGTSVQANYTQNDETAADYIKNRPFYNKITTLQKSLEASETPTNVSGALNLIEGNEYSYTFTDTAGVQRTFKVVASNLSEIVGINYIGFVDFENETSLVIVDGAKVDEDENFLDADGFIYTCTYNFSISGEAGEIKKIDKQFLPDDIATKLEVATSETLGGVMPLSVQENPSATQDVFVNSETGRLYTYPGQTYSPASISQLGLVLVGEDISSSEGYLSTGTTIDGRLYAKAPQVDSTVDFASSNAVSGAAVYTFIEELLAEEEY